MLTNNFYNCFLAGAFGVPDLKYRTFEGTERTLSTSSTNAIIPKMNNMNMYRSSNVSNYYGIAIGSGTTAPSVMDFALEKIESSSLAVTIKSDIVRNNDSATYTAVLTVKNNRNSEVTISEVGHYDQTVYSGGSNYPALTDRTLLDEPVTIPAGGVGEITYTITINYPMSAIVPEE